MPAAAAPPPQQQPLAERAGAPSPAPAAGDAPIEATGGKAAVVIAQPLVAVSGAPLPAAPASPLLAWPRKELVFERVELRKPAIKRVAATPVAPVAPLAPQLVELPPKKLPHRVVPTFSKPGIAVQPIIARKTLLPAKTLELPEVAAWVPVRAAPAVISGSPISGDGGIPVFKGKFSMLG